MNYCPNCGTPLTIRIVHGQERPACPNCRFVHYAGPKVAVGVIAVADGRLLLNLRAIDPGKGSWSFPSGYVDLGETPESAAIREVKEETGFDVALDGLVGVYSSPNRPVVFIVYSGSVVGGEATGCDEVEAVGYFDPANLPPLAFDHDTRIIGDWQRGTGRRRVTTGGNG